MQKMPPMCREDELVNRFASLLGTKGAAAKKDAVASSLISSDPVAETTRALMLCLSKKVESHEVICTLPALDMRNVDDGGGTSPLPKVGEHADSTTNTPPGVKPQMEASVLSNAADASAKAAQVEQKAAQSLGSITSWTKSSVAYAPGAVSKNIADSFSSLVDSRVRAWTLLLLRHSLTTGDTVSRSRLLTMLSSIIKIDSASTSFKTLPLPDSARGHEKDSDVILPLLLEVDMQVSIQSQAEKVTLRAPGTISGNFEKGVGDMSQLSLTKVDIRLDTGAMLDSMVQQARMVVFKAVAKATSQTEALQMDQQGGGDMAKKLDLSNPPAAASLSGFSSALNISASERYTAGSVGSSVPEGPYQPSHRLQKAKSSALKLNSVLQGGGGLHHDSSGLKKKTRSIQWDARMDLPKVKTQATPSPKRQRVTQQPNRLTSFKSFGRPHAGDFGSGPRNATFGDFGRKPVWGRDGKLASRPTPINQADLNADPFAPVTASASSRKNATFDFQRPPIHLSSGLDLGIKRKQKQDMNRVPKTIPRTATALEGWLIEKTAAKK